MKITDGTKFKRIYTIEHLEHDLDTLDQQLKEITEHVSYLKVKIVNKLRGEVKNYE